MVRCIHLQLILDPETVCEYHIRLTLSSCSGFILVTMEATEIEQHGVAFTDLEQFMVVNVAWHIMVKCKIPKSKFMNNAKDTTCMVH